MDDPPQVCGVDRVANRREEFQNPVRRWPGILCDQHIERLAVHVVHHDVAEARPRAAIVNGGDVRMTQAGQRFDLPIKPIAVTCVGKMRPWKHLDRNRAPSGALNGLIHRSLPAAVNRADDVVTGDCWLRPWQVRRFLVAATADWVCVRAALRLLNQPQNAQPLSERRHQLGVRAYHRVLRHQFAVCAATDHVRKNTSEAVSRITRERH